MASVGHVLWDVQVGARPVTGRGGHEFHHVPETEEWLPGFQIELVGVPRARLDDQLSQLSLAPRPPQHRRAEVHSRIPDVVEVNRVNGAILREEQSGAGEEHPFLLTGEAGDGHDLVVADFSDLPEALLDLGAPVIERLGPDARSSPG